MERTVSEGILVSMQTKSMLQYLTYILHLIKIRTFLKEIDSYSEKYKFARRFEGLKLN